jgi:hypothetical protein
MVQKPSRSGEKIEVEPDAWERFRVAVKAVAKAGPQHREASKPKRRKRSAKKQ